MAALHWSGVLAMFLHQSVVAQTSRVIVPDPQDWVLNAHGNFAGQIERPLRYFPDGRDFVITNGVEFFNRPLYCMNAPFRADGGDKPEFSLYLPGRGGNLRFGLKTSGGVKWLNDARQIVARYRPGSMLYEVRDPLLGDSVLNLAVLPLSETRGIIARAELWGAISPVEWVWVFGGANGMKGQRGGDIGCEREPVAKFFQLRAEQCADSELSITQNAFVLRSKTATIAGVASAGSELAVADASQWANLAGLLASANGRERLPVVVGRVVLSQGQPVYLALRQLEHNSQAVSAAGLPNFFSTAEGRRRAIAERVVVETPDAFINAAAAALNVAADAVWDNKQQAFMHGAVAWRTRLLGWRGSYAGDELGWHQRTAAHFAGFAKQQNTRPVLETLPPADENANLARNEAGLHSNGDMTKSHYDMNLVAVDAFFRHLLWTGDLDYARQMWPTIERHLAWERRLFRREFGADKLPLYEVYAAIWASDNMQYNGGGVTHASAYNYWHNKMAARVAKLLGKDTALYEREADLILQAMQKHLWLANEGWFAEFKDYLGLQLAHPNAGLWTFYHTLDSEVPTPFEAWQMTRFVDTQIAHIPIRGPGVPPEHLFTLPETSWMPYMWSVNNVVMAEVAHTSLAYWQAGRAEAAFPVFKGCLLNSMFLGLCPGNVGAMTCFDMARGEAQRDFADGCGATSRALVEGLFGVQPDALAGELKIRPGFPAQWNHARITHPDLNFAFRRVGSTETFSVEQKFSKPQALRLEIPALRESVGSLTVNGQPAKWQMVKDCVGWPRIEIEDAAAARQEVVIQWRGPTPAGVSAPAALVRGGELEAKIGGHELSTVNDPQNALSQLVVGEFGFHAQATGSPGQRTVFAHLRQGELNWWQPVTFEIRAGPEAGAPDVMDWKKNLPATARFESVDLTPVFNDKVTQIFRNEYRSPRSPFVSLAQPKQGIGGWCDFKTRFTVDDAGLRAAAARGGGKIILPNGVPLQTPGDADAKNIVFTSQWDNYPREVSVPLSGRSSHAFLLMAGSSNPMQSRFDNGAVIVTYADGASARLALHNPTTWWPIDQDYFMDDYAFCRDEPIPPRVDLRTGKIRILDVESFKGKGGKVPGGAATVLDLPLAATKELKSLTVRALANEVVIGLMSVTLAR
ncbi:MAG: DUF4450 domain-containing protein [Verrucomicrobiota bacterium]